AAAHRSWTAAGIGSIIAAALVACSPSLAPALIVLWIVGIVLTAALNRGHGLAQVIWLVVPTAVVFAPLAWHRVRSGETAALLADPGVPLAADTGTDAVRRMLLVLGFPSADGAAGAHGWSELVDPAIALWAPLLVAPVLVLALAAPLLARVAPTAMTLLAAAVGLATACLAIGITVTVDAEAPVPLWPGAALSLYWLGLLSAAALGLDALPRRIRLRAPLVALTMLMLAVSAVPALTAVPRGTSALTDGPSSTLPAYVEAEGRAGLGNATFVVTPASDGSVIAEVVWGETSSLGGQTTLRSARTGPDAGDAATAQAVAELIADPSGDVVARLAEHGVAFVLLATATGESEAARAVRIEAETSLNQRDDLEIVGDTGKGMLWRITADVTDRDTTATARAARIGLLQLGIVVVSLLLAVPTRRSLAQSRRRPRVIGQRKGGDA
ncbi:MAG: glycosyl transferase, partial [Microbacterium sp.]